MDTEIETQGQGQGHTSIHPDTHIGTVALTVADLDRSIAFYERAIGFSQLDRSEGTAVLGVDGEPLLLLAAQPGARPKPRAATGLYHFAILVPNRVELARSLARLLRAGHDLPGQADHLVSEALYLSDPDGNGIEIYRDRPRQEWPRVDGQIRMANKPIDWNHLLGEVADDDGPDMGLPAGTRIGHIHLQVADIDAARRFYVDILGFDVITGWPEALFVSAGGYHHHVGLNTWESRGGPRQPADAAGLRLYTIVLPDAEELARVQGRLEEAGILISGQGDGIAIHDPWDNGILLTGAR